MPDSARPRRLAQSASPYLCQHADQPVDWWPWGPDALEAARREQKPILLSVGYSACHWCHVMARESFEDPKIAAQMNAGFICIKVDREERPDVDAVYQRALSLLGRGGGWPLTVFLTPEQRPFFGGTYFAPEARADRPGFGELLEHIDGLWREQPETVAGHAEAFARGYAELDEAFDAAAAAKGGDPDREVTPSLWESARQDEAERRLLERWDPKYGGARGAPKFPDAPTMAWLELRARAEGGRGAASEALRTQLEGMWRGGIYDHLGGGFCRYAVDERWGVPHFEKMLYDNATLIRAYARASVLWPETEDWRRVLRSCIAFVERELASAAGLFYAALSAESEGEEGRYYLWRAAEIDAVLGPELGPRVRSVYGVTGPEVERGGATTLTFDLPLEHWAACFDTSPRKLADELRKARNALFEARADRSAPPRDDKVITSWNAWMIRALCAAADATESWDEGARSRAEAQSWTQLARRAFDALVEAVRLEGEGPLRLARRPTRGEAPILGYLEDYAALGLAALDLHQRDADPGSLALAVAAAEVCLARFAREGGGFFETDAEAPALIERLESRNDAALPSGAAMAVELLARLELGERAVAGARAQIDATCERFAHVAHRPRGFGGMLEASGWRAPAAVHVTLRGPADAGVEGLARGELAQTLRRFRGQAAGPVCFEFDTAPRPNAAAWVCRNEMCFAPVEEAEALRARLANC